MSTSTAYGVILIQQACGIPGTIIGSKLVDTKLGRKFTIVLSFALAFLCCFLFYINQSAPAVSFI
jgi:MFS-type transporter involved in bile tolerance (Atg22 family)